MKEAEERINAEKLAAERREMKKKLEKAMPEFEKDLEKLRADYDFPGMYTRIADFLTEFSLDDETEKPWFAMLNRLEYADKFILDLAANITRNEHKYEVTFFKEDGTKGATIESADGESVLIKEGSLEVKKDWSYFSADELARMAQRQMGLKDPMTYYLLGNFYLAMGREREGRDNLDLARGMDRTGEIGEREKRVNAKPRGSIERETPWNHKPK
jgi:hypothetical protein